MGFVPDVEAEARIAKEKRGLLLAGLGSPFRVVAENFTKYTEVELGVCEKFEEAEKIAKDYCKKNRRKKHSVFVKIRNRDNYIVGSFSEGTN